MSENRSANPELVRDLMTVGVATCSPVTPAGEVARLLLEKGLEESDVSWREKYAC